MQDNPLILQWLICSGVREYSDDICGKKLCMHNVESGTIQIRCNRCHTTNTYYRVLGDK